MSRETDSPSSVPNGRGDTPYPPGNEPYGPAGAPGDPEASRPRAKADEPKTETTLTTRVRINIPGSRPIPPVVMRTPVPEDEAGAQGEPEEQPVAEAPEREFPPAREPAEDAPSPEAPAAPAEPGGAGGEFTQETSDWFAPRKPKSRHPQGGTPAAGTPTEGASSGTHTDLPYVDAPEPPADRTATPPEGVPTVAPGAGPEEPSRVHGLVQHPDEPARPGPSDPTTGPATGELHMPPAPPQAGPQGTPAQGTPAVPPPGEDNSAAAPAGSTLGLGTGPAPFAPGGAGEGLLEGPQAAGAERLAGDPVVSGTPGDEPGEVPSGQAVSWPAATQAPPPRTESPTPPPAPQKKGRNKLVLAGVAVLGVLGIAYGAGLLLDHSDVPNGTTVVGVDIGGTTKHEAVNKLDEALGDRTTAPLKVDVDGEKSTVKPAVAGLTLDNEATVQNAAGRDYNPVSVIGSLFGVEREAEPAVSVDDEKMHSALSQLPGGSGRVSEGMVKFTGGRAVAVPGKPYKGLDAAKASESLERAYVERAASGADNTVRLPVSRQQPKVDKAELDRAVNGFGKTAMSGWVWLKAGDVTVPFSEQTLGSLLTMRLGGDKLQPVIDVKKLKASYGTAFDDVVVEGGSATVPMQPQHAAAAMVQALKKEAPASPQKRVAEVPGATSQ